MHALPGPKAWPKLLHPRFIIHWQHARFARTLCCQRVRLHLRDSPPQSLWDFVCLSHPSKSCRFQPAPCGRDSSSSGRCAIHVTLLSTRLLNCAENATRMECRRGFLAMWVRSGVSAASPRAR
jgi:hypothetical protein